MQDTKRWIAIAFTVAALLGTESRGLANGFRVYTKVYDMQVPTDDSQPQVVGRSLTLFHAGKSYDYIKAAGEVIIFDPANDQFIVLNTRNAVATTVDFDVVRVMLKERIAQMEHLINELEVSRADNAELVKNALRGQLAPNFQRAFDQDTGELSLRSPYCRYNVNCVTINDAAVVETYLQYADWTARLNCLLNPRAMFPEPRLELNESLRKLKRLPTSVELVARDEQTIHLKAEHKIGWKLESHDRILIHAWESMLKDKQTEFKTFREYQKGQLTASK